MIGNTRLFQAVYALSTMEGDVRKRVVVAMREISVLGEHEFKNKILWKRIEALKTKTTKKGNFLINGKIIKDALDNTADRSVNKTYTTHAKEIFSIWLEDMQN